MLHYKNNLLLIALKLIDYLIANIYTIFASNKINFESTEEHMFSYDK